MWDWLPRSKAVQRKLRLGVSAIIAVWAWVALFTAGSVVSTEPYRDPLTNPELPVGDLTDIAVMVSSLIVIALCYTPPNIALLCCVSALAGALGRASLVSDRKASSGSEPDPTEDLIVRIEKTEYTDEPDDATAEATGESPDPSKVSTAQTMEASKTALIRAAIETNVAVDVSYTTVILRGFCIYLIVISGLLILTGEPFVASTPDQYIRLAGTSSLLAFLAGYNPDIFSKILDRVGAATNRASG